MVTSLPSRLTRWEGYELASPFIIILTLVSTRIHAYARRRLGEPQWPAPLPPLLPVHRGKHLLPDLFRVPGVLYMLHDNALQRSSRYWSQRHRWPSGG